MGVVDDWHSRAAASPQRILLADGDDERAVEAAQRLRRDGLAEPLLIGRDVGGLADAGHPAAEDLLAELAAVSEGPWTDRPLDAADPLVIAAALVATGWAAGAVGGATRPTAEVIRAGLRIVGLAADATVLSSSFFFVLPDGRPVVYGDCGVLADPSAEQLACVALSCAATFAELAGAVPRVAMLSFSTKGSASHPRVEKVAEATRLLWEQAPGLAADGELQFDAAFVHEVAEAKAPGSAVAGNANVFVFPDLDSGNIAYKITERIGGARAFGPLLQGLDGVLHDVSRGCSADDIVNVAAIAALQAISRQVA